MQFRFCRNDLKHIKRNRARATTAPRHAGRQGRVGSARSRSLRRRLRPSARRRRGRETPQSGRPRAGPVDPGLRGCEAGRSCCLLPAVLRARSSGCWGGGGRGTARVGRGGGDRRKTSGLVGSLWYNAPSRVKRGTGGAWGFCCCHPR